MPPLAGKDCRLKTPFRMSQMLLAGVIFAGALGAALAVAVPGQATGKLSQPETLSVAAWPLAWGQPLPVKVQSHEVRWRGAAYRLVEVTSAQFNLDAVTSQLQADLKVAITSFDQVTYEISVAVFDAQGRLLGAARAVCPVARIWLGNLVLSSRSMTLDFGTSLDYAQAAKFTVSVSRCPVLTPEEWMKK
jgi:hypothetical protein